jgi:hypothetical protein
MFQAFFTLPRQQFCCAGELRLYAWRDEFLQALKSVSGITIFFTVTP